MILIAIIGISVSVANKKKTAEAQKKRSAFPETGSPAPGSAPTPQNRSTSPKASTTTKSTTPSKTPSAPGTSKWPWPTQDTAQPQKKTASAAYGGTPRYTHVVTSTLEGGHTHTESSMTGEEACPPSKAASQKQVEKAPAAEPAAGGLLSFQPNSVLQGVLFAEILGKPKALQRK